MSFDTALQFVLSEEGGYVNNKFDAGGATNHGVTQAVYDDYRKTKGLPSQDVQLLTDAEVREIYENNYWEPSKAQLMHTPLDVAHMDWSVNHGISGALKTLQAALGVSADGIWGAQTASALASCDTYETMKAYNTLRRQWYENRVVQKPDQQIFLAGWLGRVDRLEAYCEGL